MGVGVGEVRVVVVGGCKVFFTEANFIFMATQITAVN